MSNKTFLSGIHWFQSRKLWFHSGSDEALSQLHTNTISIRYINNYKLVQKYQDIENEKTYSIWESDFIFDFSLWGRLLFLPLEKALLKSIINEEIVKYWISVVKNNIYFDDIVKYLCYYTYLTHLIYILLFIHSCIVFYKWLVYCLYWMFHIHNMYFNIRGWTK